MFVCLFVCAYDSRYACGGTATAETSFPGRDPEYTRVTAEETRCRIATSPLVDHPSNRRPAHSLLGEVPLVTTLKRLKVASFCEWLGSSMPRTGAHTIFEQLFEKTKEKAPWAHQTATFFRNTSMIAFAYA